MAQIVRVEGLSDLLDGLDELKKATATNVQKRALIEGGEPIEKEAERLAPHLTGALRRSITTSNKLSNRQRSLYQRESKVEIFVGAGALAQATLQEFGTVHDKPQPFMRPAWQQQKMNALLKIRDALAEEIEKARKRAARKQARLIAQSKT